MPVDIRSWCLITRSSSSTSIKLKSSVYARTSRVLPDQLSYINRSYRRKWLTQTVEHVDALLPSPDIFYFINSDEGLMPSPSALVAGLSAVLADNYLTQCRTNTWDKLKVQIPGAKGDVETNSSPHVRLTARQPTFHFTGNSPFRQPRQPDCS